MTSNIRNLRTRLQLVSSELQSITDSDLSECKWTIKKRIFYELISNCPNLSEHFQELTTKVDSREEEVARHRKANEPRERKFECEQLLRTDFMTIVLGCLTHLRWPPTLEAFSDPLGSLLNDSEFVLSAISYILDIAIPSDPRRDRHPEIASQGREPILSNSSRPLSGHKSRDKKQNFDSLLTLDTSSINMETSAITQPDKHGFKMLDQLSCVSEDSIVSSRTAGRDNPNTVPKHSTGPPHRQSMNFNHASTSADNMKDVKTSLQILQHQNEILAKHVKQLHLSICARENAETKMSALLHELSKTIEEITDVGSASSPSSSSTSVRKSLLVVAGGDDTRTRAITTSNHSNNSGIDASNKRAPSGTTANNSISGKNKYSAGGSARGSSTVVNDSSITAEEEERFKQLVLQEIEREDALRRAAANQVGAGGGKIIIRSLSEFEATQRVKEKLGLSAAALPPPRPSAASASSSSSSSKLTHSSSGNNSSSYSSGGGGGGGSSVIWSKLRDRIAAIVGQWDTAIREARMTVLAAVSVPPETTNYFRGGEGRTGAAESSKISRGGGGGGAFTSRSASGNLTHRSTFSTASTPSTLYSSPSQLRSHYPHSRESARAESFPTQEPVRVLLHQVLGVNPTLTGLSGAGLEAADDCGAEFDVADLSCFDLGRLHVLQRDLVAFVAAAFEYCDTGQGKLVGGSNVSSRSTKSSSSRPLRSAAGSAAGEGTGLSPRGEDSATLSVRRASSARPNSASSGRSSSSSISSRGEAGGVGSVTEVRSTSRSRPQPASRDSVSGPKALSQSSSVNAKSRQPAKDDDSEVMAVRMLGSETDPLVAVDSFSVYSASTAAADPPLCPLWTQASLNHCQDPLPESAAVAERVLQIQELMLRAQNMLVRLSALAPIAPIGTDSPMASHLTGLEALLEEVSKQIPKGHRTGGKSSGLHLRLQAAGDRAQAEQVAVVRCLVRLRSYLHQWAVNGQRVAPLLEKLGTKVKGIVLGCVGQVRELAASVRKIRDALQTAEDSRVGVEEMESVEGVGAASGGGSGGGSSSGRSINIAGIDTMKGTRDKDTKRRVTSAGVPMGGAGGTAAGVSGVTANLTFLSLVPGTAPLDALCRGVLGSPVAELVLMLRMHTSELADLEGRLEVAAARMQGGINEEVTALYRIKDELLAAAAASQAELNHRQ